MRMVMKMKKLLLAIFICALGINLNSCVVKAEDTENLMIVAHPDDETIWGGSHLLSGNYTVVCITNGNNKTRKKEFKQAMKKTNSTGIILSYPDKTNGKRDNWVSCRIKIYNKIKKIIDSKNWNTIVTHNPDGEYGHIHHRMTSQIVTKILQKENKTDKLIYFGRYVKKKDKSELTNEETISSATYREKLKVCEVYSSQKKVMKTFHHMLKYENWIPYANWDTI